MTLPDDSQSLLRGLLERYSPNGQEGPAVAYLVEQMQAAGLEACIDGAGNAVGVKGQGPNQIILLGHIDTVPGWIDVRQEGDRLWGRGAVDAKGPLACFAAAAAAANPAPGWQIIVIGAVGEESDSRGANYILDQYQPHLVIIGEPSGWERLTLGYKGSLWAEYRVTQPVAHSAARVETACETGIAFWNQLAAWAADLNQDQHRQYDQVSPSLRSMTSTSDGLYQTAVLSLNLRIPPQISRSGITESLQALAGAGTLELLDFIPAYRVDKNTSLVRAMLAAIRSHGGKPVFSVKSGTSDMNLVGPAWKCPMLAYGPGDSDLDHTPNEHIAIPEYLAAIDILRVALDALTASVLADCATPD